VWRLLASNNRELGRSAQTYNSFDAARAHVLQLQEQADALVVTAVPGTSAGTHGWLATIDDTAVMTTGRWYGATSSSLEAAAGTIAALRAAFVTICPRGAEAAGRRAGRDVKNPEPGSLW
jgi:predicted phage tail protein